MPYLINTNSGVDGRVIKLFVGVNTIGRQPDNSIVKQHLSLSRHHAQITVNEHSVTLTDLNSRNGTYVNENRVQECELKDRDIIRCGDITFRFACDLEADPSLNIAKQVSPDSSRVLIGDLLSQALGRDTSRVLKIRPQDSNQRALAKLQILLEVSKQLSLPEDPDKLLDKILNLLFDIMEVDRSVILMVDELTGQLENKAVKCKIGLGNCDNDRFYSTQITNFVLAHGDAILTKDAQSDKRFDGSASVLGLSIRASMCVPLKPKDEIIGLLYVDNLSTSNAYESEDLEFLTALANQAAIAIENARLYRQIEAEAVVRAKFERFFPQSVRQKLQEEGNLEIIDTEVTALFSDISAFTELSSVMEPRQIISMLNDYFQVMVEGIVFYFEGTLEKYIGDALLAIWGAPYQKSDDADRAVWAAIAMQKAVCDLNTRWMQERNFGIQIHIGINSGRVAAGNIGSPKLIQYATIGDTTNVTSRICNVAQPGEIVISQNTCDRLAIRNLPLEKLPPAIVKGKSTALQLYRLHWQQVESIKLSDLATYSPENSKI
jgi:adenylate cyclase